MPRIIGGSLAEHRDLTRRALFASLDRLMRERGFDALSLAEIAQDAGVGRTSVYNHFADKEALLLGFIEQETADFTEALTARLAAIDDPVEQLRTYVREQLQLDRSYHSAPGPALKEIISRDAAENLRAHVGRVELLLRGILAQARAQELIGESDFDVTVQLVHACLSGRRLPTDEAEREEFIIATQEFVLRAVGVRIPAAPAFA
ncbi:TetR/AcrR family transcriptional regulator [Georgenia sp. Z1491]|uniref:TetR/AcrR family transcriptional regulator n=1 Tax=Georgenia sp. Z1491 TaxID=3416707 RepID=UPI003CF17C6C